MSSQLKMTRKASLLSHLQSSQSESEYRARDSKISAERAIPPGWSTPAIWNHVTALDRADL